jgi:transcriptional regulator with XRE-family HTH domain
MLGERIKRLRAEQDFSFDAFVEETGLGRGYISELERGIVVPSFTTLVRVAAALDTSVSALVATGSTSLEALVDVARSLTDVQQKRLLQEARRLALRKKSPTPRPEPTESKKPRRGSAL